MLSGKQSDLILLNFSKGFGKVNHLKLLYKLQLHGVHDKIRGLIVSFLIGRTQCVVLDGDSLTELPVSSGVPQGSVLGPILFLLYINELPDNIQSNVRIFADDTAVYLTVKDRKMQIFSKMTLMFSRSGKRHGIWNLIHPSVKSCTYPGNSKLLQICLFPLNCCIHYSSIFL